MNSSIIKLSFEVTDSYNNGGFRNFIKYLLSIDSEFEVFIISDNNSPVYVSAVGQQLGIDEDNVIICSFTDDKLAAIAGNDIDIHLDNIQSFVELVEDTTDARGVLVSAAQDRYNVEPKYLSDFNTAVQIIKRERSET